MPRKRRKPRPPEEEEQIARRRAFRHDRCPLRGPRLQRLPPWPPDKLYPCQQPYRPPDREQS